MESAGHVTVPLRGGGKKMRKRRELDALVAHSLAKRACNSGKRNIAGNGINSQDQLLSQSTDDQEDYTWPKVRNPSRCRTKRLSCLKTCGPFVLITCVFMSFGFMYWLYFDLRQQINEYRMRIEQVSASSQNIPEAFQKWHETSKNLEQNQTILQNGIIEIREVLKNFSLELNQLKDNINKQTEPSKESQFSALQNDIAVFGATIKDFKINYDTITNDKLPKLQNDIQQNKQSLTNLTQLISNQLNTTNLTSITTPSDSTRLIEELKTNMLRQITNLNAILSANITELNENFTRISETVHKQHAMLETYPDQFLNMSTKITSIENDWTQYKPTILSFEQFVKNVSIDTNDLRTKTNTLNTVINMVQNECTSYHQQNDNITNEIQLIKEKLDRNRHEASLVPPAGAAAAAAVVPQQQQLRTLPAPAAVSIVPNNATKIETNNSVAPTAIVVSSGTSASTTATTPTESSPITLIKTTATQPPPSPVEGKPKLLSVTN